MRKEKLEVIERNIDMTTEDIRERFTQKKYGQIVEMRETKDKDKKRIADRAYETTSMSSIFDYLLDKYKVIFPQSYFVEFAKKQVRETCRLNGDDSVFDDPEMEAVIHNRIKRAYMGFLVELYATLLIKENMEDYIIMSNRRVDIIKGIDFFLLSRKTGRIYNIHVTSFRGKDRFIEKKKRRGEDRESFDQDKYILYDSVRNHTGTSEIINTFPFPTLDQITNSLSEWEKESNDLSFKHSKLNKYIQQYGGKWDVILTDKRSEKNKNKMVNTVITFKNYVKKNTPVRN